MEVEAPDGTPAPEPIITIEEDEEVMLYWDWGGRSNHKSIRELAEGAMDSKAHGETTDDDSSVLEYYR